jgi:hypothetical protein
MVLGKFKEAMMSQFRQQDPQQKVPFDDEIAKFVEDEYQQRREARLPFELQWRLNTEFINGNQYLDIETASSSIQEIPKLNWHQEREVFNQIAPIHETRVAQLSRTVPILKVRPASQDESDIGAAKVSSGLLQAQWHEENMDVIWDDLCSWTELTGTAFIKSVWNKDKGQIVFTEQVPKQGPKEEPQLKNGDTPQVQELLETDYENVDTHEGDIEACVVSPYEMFPDNNYASSIKGLNSLIHARAYHIRDIEEIWGVKIEPEKVDVLTQQQVQSGLGGIGYSAGSFRGKSSQMQNHAIVKEYYERPSKKYAEGRFIVVAHNKTLHVGPLPYQIGNNDERDFPFSISRSIKIPGNFWGKSTIERLIPLQRRYNALRNRKAEYLNRVVIGQWYEPEGSLSEDSELNDEPGNVIRYRPTAGHRPEPVQMPGLPSEFESEVHTLLSEFTAISGVSELSRYSQAPPGVKSGVALSIANEQDNTRISNTASNLAQCIKTMGQQWLRLYKQFAQEPRVLRVAGREKDVEVMDWTASMLRSDDVIIENSSALAETPAQRRQMVFDMLQSGLFAKEEVSQVSESSRRKIFEMLEYGNWEEALMEMTRLQEQKAKRENMKIKQGEMIAINDYDDDNLHIEMHNRLRMSAEYEDLIKTPGMEMIEQIMAQHIAEHNERIASQVQAAQQQELDQIKAQQTIENEGKAQLQALVNEGRIQSQELANEGKLQSQELANESKDNQPKQT